MLCKSHPHQALPIAHTMRLSALRIFADLVGVWAYRAAAVCTRRNHPHSAGPKERPFAPREEGDFICHNVNPMGTVQAVGKVAVSHRSDAVGGFSRPSGDLSPLPGRGTRRGSQDDQASGEDPACGLREEGTCRQRKRPRGDRAGRARAEARRHRSGMAWRDGDPADTALAPRGVGRRPYPSLSVDARKPSPSRRPQ